MKIKIFLFFGILAVSFLSYCFFPVLFFRWVQDAPGNIYVTDRNGQVIIDKPTAWWFRLDSQINLQADFIDHLITMEDKNFYSHYWIDIFSKLWALHSNIISWKVVSWGSTITEQTIKNKYFINQKRTYLHKAREAVLALSFSMYYSKDEILQDYLQNVYLWKNNYGISAAMQVYFQKDNLAALSQQEQVILLALIKYPGIQNINEKYFVEYCEKIKNKLWFSYEKKAYNLHPKKSIDILPWAQDFPSIDARLQLYAKDIINNTLDELADKNVTNAAVYAINPKNSEVIIYQASRDFYSSHTDGQVDIITSKRQMWSTIKPFAYLLALEKSAWTESLLLDVDTQYDWFQDNKTYTSSNYNLKNYGLIRLKKALWNSLNNASVRLVQHLGLYKTFDWYEKFWFSFDYPAEHYGYSFVLWSPNVTLKSLVESYAKLLPDNSDIAGWDSKFLLYDILSNPDNRDISFWVNSVLNTSVKMAVKTGTSSNFRDNVVVSYHPDLVIWVWVGNNDGSSMKSVTGISGAGYIWRQIAEKAIELWYITSTQPTMPDSVQSINYCLDIHCFRRENIYVSQSNSQYFSAIADQIYDPKDIFINISHEEEKILEDMGF